eukprot:PITA_08830
MHSLISIVGVVLISKENYSEWSRKIKHTLIFNELWNRLCVGNRDKEPEQPTSSKEFAIWENKNNKSYALIVASLNEELLSLLKRLCVLHIEKKNLSQESSRGRGGQRGRGRNFRGRGGRHSQGEKLDLHYIRCKRDGLHDASTCKFPWDRIEQERNQPKGKTNDKEKGKELEFTHYVVAHYNIGVNEDLFNASLASWKNDWFLDSRETCHMTFRRYFFEEFIDNVDGVVYFADKSKLKPSELGTIKLKLPGIPNFLLHHVLYLPQLRINLLSLVQIHQQGHSIHMFDDKLEVRKASNHSLGMMGIEEERLLKL